MISVDQVQALGGFRVLYADPAWKYRDKKPRGGAERHYQTMSVEEICALPVSRIAAADAALFLWATWPTLPDALRVMDAWGFTYKTCAFAWLKTNTVAPTPFVGLGHWTRGNTEPCFLATRGDVERVSKRVQQVIVSEVDDTIVAPRGRHSAKPEEARKRIVELMRPDAPAVELFARERVPGWDAWGNEIESTVDLLGNLKGRAA